MPSGDEIRSSRLKSFLEREKAVKAAIAEERVRLLKRRERTAARIAAIIGSVLVRHAESASDFRLMIMHVLRSAELTEAERNFLTRQGWL